jgi:hypothetical protein
MSTPQLITNYSYRDTEWTESRQHFAFNQTRNTYLGLNVIVGDFSLPSLASWISTVTPNSSAGLWIAPFRGLPTTNVDLLLDLTFLDANCRVIDLVESFPRFKLPPSSRPASSVLVLPSKAIAFSETRRGDSLVICTGEELAKLRSQAGSTRSRFHTTAGAIQVPGHAGAKTILFPGGVHREKPAEEVVPSIAPKAIEPIQVKENVSTPPLQRGLLARWFFPTPSSDRRKAPRKLVDNVTASFWTGGVPAVDVVRDISTSGLFVVTKERWYPGTIIRMTLSKVASFEQAFDTSICVCTEAIRWGNDGVGLRFAVDDAQKNAGGRRQPVEGANREQLDQFLESLLNDDK